MFARAARVSAAVARFRRASAGSVTGQTLLLGDETVSFNDVVRMFARLEMFTPAVNSRIVHGAVRMITGHGDMLPQEHPQNASSEVTFAEWVEMLARVAVLEQDQHQRHTGGNSSIITPGEKDWEQGKPPPLRGCTGEPEEGATRCVGPCKLSRKHAVPKGRTCHPRSSVTLQIVILSVPRQMLCVLEMKF